MSDGSSAFPATLVAAVILAGLGALGAWFLYDGSPEESLESGNPGRSDAGDIRKKVSINNSGRATVELDDPTLRLAFFGPDGNENHVIRVGDLPRSQRACVRLVHPGLPPDSTFMANLDDQGVRAADDTIGSTASVSGKPVTRDRLQACADAAWVGKSVGEQVTAFARESAKLHPESSRAKSAERAKRLLKESTSPPPSDTGTRNR